MKNKIKESAVTESVGVILIAALTVIMAAIIATYAFGLVQGIPMTRTVVVTVDHHPDGTPMVTYRGGPDQGSLESLTIKLPDDEQPWPNPVIGESKDMTAGSYRIMVIGHFRDNSDMIVVDTMT